jgi:superfamily II DNA or RNA helicase
VNNLFGPISRDERQAQCIENWKKFKGKATVVGATGFGKTRVGTNLIGKVLKIKPQFRFLIVVPTTTLKEQWEGILDNLGYGLNCSVEVVNTVVLHETIYTCDLLILDEIHRFASDLFQQVFSKVKYKLILGLTATIERLDGKEAVIKQYCPVCDEIPLEECEFNGWISKYKEYQVLIDVDDIQTYKNLNKEFNEHFGFFNYDFGLVMSMVGPKGYLTRIAYRDRLCPNGTQEEKSATLKSIIYHSTAFMRALQGRKSFINNHPKKIEIARKIIQSRPYAKIITFSNNIKMAEAIGIGKVYSGKDSKKKGRATLEELESGDIQVINTIAKANEGLNIPDLSIAIMLGIDSSKIKAVQRVGRVCRAQENKQAEIFNLVINDTAETEWFRKAHSKSQYITIDETGLEAVLNYEEPKPYKKKIQKLTFRF